MLALVVEPEVVQRVAHPLDHPVGDARDGLQRGAVFAEKVADGDDLVLREASPGPSGELHQLADRRSLQCLDLGVGWRGRCRDHHGLLDVRSAGDGRARPAAVQPALLAPLGDASVCLGHSHGDASFRTREGYEKLE